MFYFGDWSFATGAIKLKVGLRECYVKFSVEELNSKLHGEQANM